MLTVALTELIQVSPTMESVSENVSLQRFNQVYTDNFCIIDVEIILKTDFNAWTRIASPNLTFNPKQGVFSSDSKFYLSDKYNLNIGGAVLSAGTYHCHIVATI